jgi:hypothetical protein
MISCGTVGRGSEGYKRWRGLHLFRYARNTVSYLDSHYVSRQAVLSFVFASDEMTWLLFMSAGQEGAQSVLERPVT